MNKLSKLLFICAGLLVFSPLSYAVFSDVSSSHPYFKAISYLEENGTVEGYEDGSFRPGQEVNRAEALKIILLGSDILVPEIAEQDIFPDVLRGAWYAKYAAKAKNLGIVHGDDATGMFRPGDTINLAEILKILLEANNIALRNPEDFERRPYADVPTDAWFAPYFDYADSIHLLEEDENFNVFPATPVTRGLMARLIYQLDMKPEGYQEGEASYYGEKFHGKGTANGEVFDASGFTAAHRTLPFDTWLRVRNLANGKEVYVRVNDRGPYADTENRIIDLSKAAFESIASLSSGVINVSITPVSGPPEGQQEEAEEETENQSAEEAVPTEETAQAVCPEADQLQYIAKDVFENITLDEDFPDTFLASEVLTLSGHSASENGRVSAFVVDTGENQFPYYADRDGQGDFTLNVFFPAPGDYHLGMLPGESGSSIVQDIRVLADSCLTQSTDESLFQLSNLKLSIRDGETTVRWTDEHGYELTKVVFSQGSKQKTYLVYGEDKLTPNYADFEGWGKGQVTVSVRGADLEKNSVLDSSALVWGPAQEISFQAETHYQYVVVKNNVTLTSVPNTLQSGSSFQLKFDPKVNIQELGQIILPSGLVQNISLQSPSHSPVTSVATGESVYPANAGELSLTVTPQSNEVHLIEINNEQSLAVINIPVYPADAYPLLPNPVELAFNEKYTLGTNLNALRTEMLGLVNADRAAHGLPALKIDQTLSQLAQSRSDDLVANNYFSHWNLDGFTANDLRTDFAITQYVSENLSKDSSPTLAEYDLMRSASHRANILKSEWKRAGFGFTQAPDGIIFVQIFSDDPIDFSDKAQLRSDILAAINAERSNPLSLADNLNDLAQNWSDRMVEEGFFNFTAPDGSGLVDTIRDSGVSATLGTYIVGNSSFESGTEQITENEQIKEPHWNSLGIGLKQDSFGIIKFTLLYTE
jgi:rare lipoprotein A